MLKRKEKERIRFLLEWFLFCLVMHRIPGWLHGVLIRVGCLQRGKPSMKEREVNKVWLLVSGCGLRCVYMFCKWVYCGPIYSYYMLMKSVPATSGAWTDTVLVLVWLYQSKFHSPWHTTQPLVCLENMRNWSQLEKMCWCLDQTGSLPNGNPLLNNVTQIGHRTGQASDSGFSSLTLHDKFGISVSVLPVHWCTDCLHSADMYEHQCQCDCDCVHKCWECLSRCGENSCLFDIWCVVMPGAWE